jgi:hypothetical protein
VAKNPTINIDKRQVMFNIITILGMILFSLTVDAENISWADVGAGIVSVGIQLNILFFCWNLVSLPKNDDHFEKASSAPILASVVEQVLTAEQPKE